MIKRLTKVRLPDEYQRVEYLESSGTQWIDTNFVPTSASSIYSTFLQLSRKGEYKGDMFVFGQQTINTTKGVVFVEQYESSNRNFTWYVRFGSTSSVSTACTEKEYTEKCSVCLEKGSFVVNDVKKSSPTYASLDTSSITLFAKKNTSSVAVCSKIKMYSFDIVEGTEKVFQLIPVYRKSDNKPGMYDLVSGQFFTNQGTGEFIVGEDINEPIEVWHTVKNIKRMVGGTTKDIHTIKRVVGGEVKTITI